MESPMNTKPVVVLGVMCLSVLPLVASAVAPQSPAARQCLHDGSETAEQKARRLEALTATRNINNIQANRPEARDRQYLRQDQLAAAPYAQKMKNSTSEVDRRISLNPIQDILPGWKLTLDPTEGGYWFMIKDTTDACGYAFISNQNGVIYTSEPLR
jgi:hypothetical protein